MHGVRFDAGLRTWSPGAERKCLNPAGPEADGENGGAREGSGVHREDWLALVESCGYHPVLDPDGDIVFAKADLQYLVLFTPGPAGLVRLALPNFWPIESRQELVRVLRAAAAVHAGASPATFYPVGDNTWGCVTLWPCASACMAQLFPLALAELDQAVQEFAHLMAG